MHIEYLPRLYAKLNLKIQHILSVPVWGALCDGQMFQMCVTDRRVWAY